MFFGFDDKNTSLAHRGDTAAAQSGRPSRAGALSPLPSGMVSSDRTTQGEGCHPVPCLGVPEDRALSSFVLGTLLLPEAPGSTVIPRSLITDATYLRSSPVSLR